MPAGKSRPVPFPAPDAAPCPIGPPIEAAPAAPRHPASTKGGPFPTKRRGGPTNGMGPPARCPKVHTRHDPTPRNLTNLTGYRRGKRRPSTCVTLFHPLSLRVTHCHLAERRSAGGGIRARRGGGDRTALRLVESHVKPRPVRRSHKCRRIWGCRKIGGNGTH